MRAKYVLLLVFVWLNCRTGELSAQIRPCPQNPWYWEYRNRPTFLVGASDRDNIFQWADDGTKLIDQLDLLARCGGNYIRCTMSSRHYAPGRFRWDVLPYPFAKKDGKYDLTVWNEEYWSRFRRFLTETQKRGIIVQLELWDRWNESGDSNRSKAASGWFYSPWNPNNNVNYDWRDSPLLKPGRTGFYNPFHYAAAVKDPVLLAYQQRFIQKILDEIVAGDFDHVLFQIDNESGIGDESLEPDVYWARYVREYGKKQKPPRDWYVCTSRRFHPPTPYRTETFQDWNNPEVRVPVVNPAFNYCDLSQNNGTTGQTHYDNLIWFRAQVAKHGPRPINHIKAYHFNWPIGLRFRDRRPGTDAEAGARLWRALFAGAASFRFHRSTTFQESGILDGFGLNQTAQKHLRSVRLFLDAVTLIDLRPHNGLLSERLDDEAYCFAEPGSQYAIFFTGGGDRSVAIDLTSSQGELQLRWLDIARSRWSGQPTMVGKGIRVLQAPGTGHWVALLLSEEQTRARQKEKRR